MPCAAMRVRNILGKPPDVGPRQIFLAVEQHEMAFFLRQIASA